MKARGTSVAREVQLNGLPIREIVAMHDYEFTLYVSGRRGGGQTAIDSVERLCELHFKDNYKLTIIDMDSTQQEARCDRVLATPALVIHRPLPKKQVIGCFENPGELARVMGVGATDGTREVSRSADRGTDAVDTP